ncbi:MAG: hypothetical protein ABIJ27_00905 [Candidatus Omnitrophota bacterium]
MVTFNRSELRGMVCDILKGKASESLTLMIKDGVPKESRLAVVKPAKIERRKNPDGREAVVNSPASRILYPVSRSPRDIWVIIYRNRTVAEGPFDEISRVLQEVPKQLLSAPSVAIKQVVLLGGLAALLAVSFMAGRMLTRSEDGHSLNAIAPQLDALRPLPQANYSKEISRIDRSLEEIIKRQEVLKSLIVSGFIKNAPQKVEAKEIKQADETGKLYDDRVRDLELKQLLELESQRSDLLLKDQELAGKGYLPLYDHRRTINSSIKTIQQKIGWLKEKYNLDRND